MARCDVALCASCVRTAHTSLAVPAGQSDDEPEAAAAGAAAGEDADVVAVAAAVGGTATAAACARANSSDHNSTSSRAPTLCSKRAMAASATMCSAVRGDTLQLGTTVPPANGEHTHAPWSKGRQGNR
jgi:hypothetical protein